MALHYDLSALSIIESATSPHECRRIIRLLSAALELQGKARDEVIARIETHIAAALDQSCLTAAVLSAPHPRFIAALEARFGESYPASVLFKGVQRSPATLLQPDGLPRDLLAELYPRLTQHNPIMALSCAAPHAIRTDEPELLEEIAARMSLTDFNIFKSMASYIPGHDRAPAMTRWAEALFNRQIKHEWFIRSSAPLVWLLEDEPHPFVAALGAGADLYPILERHSGPGGKTCWSAEIKTIGASRHLRLRLFERLRTLGGTEAIFTRSRTDLKVMLAQIARGSHD